MFEKVEITSMAHAMARHASDRQGHIANNVANADTPGYRARDLPSFAETLKGTSAVELRTTRAGHVTGTAQGQSAQTILREGEAAPNGNDVSVESEMMEAAGVRQQHEMALSIYSAARDILRASLGRGR